jgi:hypothetical protein
MCAHTDICPPVSVPVITGRSITCRTKTSGSKEVIHVYLFNRIRVDVHLVQDIGITSSCNDYYQQHTLK